MSGMRTQRADVGYLMLPDKWFRIVATSSPGSRCIPGGENVTICVDTLAYLVCYAPVPCITTWVSIPIMYQSLTATGALIIRCW